MSVFSGSIPAVVVVVELADSGYRYDLECPFRGSLLFVVDDVGANSGVRGRKIVF